MNYEEAILGLQEDLRRLLEVERLQRKIIESHSQTLMLQDENQRLLQELAQAHTKTMIAHEATLVAHEAMLLEHAEGARSHEKYQRKIDQNLSEITDKLNGLLGYMDGLHPPSA